jgi:hypothetical protein
MYMYIYMYVYIYRPFEGLSADLAGERLEQPACLELGQAEAAHERLALGRLGVRHVRDHVRLPIHYAHAVSRIDRSQQLASDSMRMHGGRTPISCIHCTARSRHVWCASGLSFNESSKAARPDSAAKPSGASSPACKLVRACV